MSENTNLKKLLRTLNEYQADALLLSCGVKPKIRLESAWRTVEKHPLIEEEALLKELQKVLGASFSRLANGLGVKFEHQDSNFWLELESTRSGPLLKIEKLVPPAPTKQRIPKKGIHILKDPSLLMSLLAQWSGGTAFSLERQSRHIFPAIIQKQLGVDFEKAEEILRSSTGLDPEFIVLNEILLDVEETRFLEQYAKERPVLVVLDRFSPLPPFKEAVLSMN